MNGPGPKQEGAALVKFLQTHKLSCKSRRGQEGALTTNWQGNPCNCGLDASVAELATLHSRLSEQADLIDRLKREKKAMADMLNVQQARAQVAAQSTAKIAQELQIWLKEQAVDVI